MAGESFEIRGEFLKADDQLGLVFGWAIVCTEDGADYYDLQGDHIPEDAMTKAALDFMQNSQVARDMHAGEQTGSVVFAFPLTADVAKAYRIKTKKTGFMIAVKPDEEMLKRFQLGELTGFSIGGFRLEDEEVEDV